MGDQLTEFVESDDAGEESKTSIQREMKSLIEVYRLAETS